MKDLYEEIMVWARNDGRSAVRYTCLRSLGTGKYGVQGADFFYLPVEDKQIRDHQKQFLELFLETDPAKRCEWFESLEEAITAHEEVFSDFDSSLH